MCNHGSIVSTIAAQQWWMITTTNQSCLLSEDPVQQAMIELSLKEHTSPMVNGKKQ
jgi:hypothetical protein